MKQTTRDYERAWAADISLSESASALVNVKIANGEPACRAIPTMAQALKGKFLVEDRSYWCPTLRKFVDLVTLTDMINLASVQSLAAQRHRKTLK